MALFLPERGGLSPRHLAVGAAPLSVGGSPAAAAAAACSPRLWRPAAGPAVVAAAVQTAAGHTAAVAPR